MAAKKTEIKPANKVEQRIALVLSRFEGESWLDAATRLAKKNGLEMEVQCAYNEYKHGGDSEEKAAWAACYDWDVLELIDLKSDV